VAAYLARFKGSSRRHTESDLRCYLAWCTERDLDPLTAQRPHLELYIRWMQEIRRLKPSTVSRRFSVAAGFYRTCVIDGVLQHSPAEHVRRPPVPAESPTLGFTHLQFEAMLTAARDSMNDYDFALVAMLGLLGLRIFEATGADIAGPGRGTRPPGTARVRQGHQGRPGPAATSGRRGHRPCRRVTNRRANPAQKPRDQDGPARRHPPPTATRPARGVPITRPHPHMLRHAFVISPAPAW
jgi:integrase/recombinase XerD